MFKPDMIRAIQLNLKTVTRRLDGLKEINKERDKWCVLCLKDEAHFWGMVIEDFTVVKPRYQVGEVVYIKEAWATENRYNHLKPREIPHTAKIFYLLDGYDPFTMGKVRSPLFMMEWMARDFIQITDVRPERLQEITLKDMWAEGMDNDMYAPTQFELLWDSINPKYSWASNPFVWRYSFIKVSRPVEV